MDITAHVINKIRNICKKAATETIEANLDLNKAMIDTRRSINGILLFLDTDNDTELAPIFVVQDIQNWSTTFLENYFGGDFKKCDCGNWHYESYCDMC